MAGKIDHLFSCEQPAVPFGTAGCSCLAIKSRFDQPSGVKIVNMLSTVSSSPKSNAIVTGSQSIVTEPDMNASCRMK